MTAALIYLHGFISSPQSHKAVILGDYLRRLHPAVEYQVPALGDTPDVAYARANAAVTAALENHDRLALIGSSMGGFLATLLAERYGLRAVLINPVVRPHLLSPHFLGEHDNPYTGSQFRVESRHIDFLAEAYLPGLSAPENLWALLQEGDETLDYRWAQDYYGCAKLTVEAGGDHSFQGLERYFDQIVEFLGLLG